MENSTTIQEDRIKYSKLLSSLFCSTSIIILSILCLLNNLSIDIYSTLVLLKVVLPAAFCFWFLGYSIGKILDGFSNKIVVEQKKSEVEAYEMPSMFAGTEIQDDEFGILWRKSILPILNSLNLVSVYI